MDSPQTVTIGEREPPIHISDVPHRIGRHVVIEAIGRGGMGVVYSAFDPDLGRRLAIKVLRPTRDGERAGGRMLEEAQALARLSHPHVIQVYDVGTYRDRVYVAMELVEGSTLRAWLRDHRRPWAEIRQMFLKAGAGLAAAHAAGLVHRDFKPSNVLVGDDGRVRVADFGLAIEPTADTDPLCAADLERLGQSGVVSALAGRMPDTGDIAGTPAYMAAEQWMGRMLDARTDQFAFCVCLYEALVGHRPFRATSRPELAAQITRELYEPIPGSVPAWLRRVVERGLRADPAARYPDMQALLADLAHDPGRRRRRLAVGGVAAALLVGGIWAGAQLREHPEPCEGAALAMDTVWSEERRAELERAVSATALPYAASTWARTEARLTEYADRWRGSRIEACSATRVRHEQSGEMLDLRMACLDRRREALEAMLGVVAEADAKLVTRLPTMVDALPAIEPCADGPTLRLHAQGLVEPARAEAHAALRAQLARVVALHHAARYEASNAAATPLAERLAAEGWPRLRAELDQHRARNHAYLGDLERAEALTMEAYLGAVRSRHDRQAVSSAVYMVTLLNDREGGLDRAEQFWNRAEAEWVRAGSVPGDRIGLLNARSGLEFRRARYADAREVLEEAVELARQIGRDEGPRFADLLGNLAAALAQSGELAQGEAYAREALALREATQGPEHPDTAREVHNLGVMVVRQGRAAEAQDLFQHAYDLKVATFGEEHPDIGLALLALGNVARDQGRNDESERHYRRALEILRETLGPTHPEVHFVLFNLGELKLDADDPEAAEPVLAEAVEILEGTHGTHYLDLADPLMRLGQARLLLGRIDAAVTTLERISSLGEEPGAHLRPEARYWLARAYGEQGDPRARSQMLALRDALADSDQGTSELRDRVRRWLREHAETGDSTVTPATP